MKRPYMKAAAILGAAAFLFTSGFARAEDHAAGTAGYLKSATYYSDDWVINFWNSESRHMDQELARIAQDGFNNIILVVPWREFQPGMSPCTYNQYAWDKLDRVMDAAAAQGLSVMLRVGYTWDYCGAGNVMERYQGLMQEGTERSAWLEYLGRLYQAASSHENFCGGFLTWEDFWNFTDSSASLGNGVKGRSMAKACGYVDYARENYELEELEEMYGHKLSGYDDLYFPARDSQARSVFYGFYDQFLNELLADSQTVFPGLSMEVRLDVDPVEHKDGSQEGFMHSSTFTSGSAAYTSAMYGIPMGFMNEHERVTAAEALEKVPVFLNRLHVYSGGKPVYLDQFLFTDNTVGYEYNAQLRDDEKSLYLEGVAPILKNSTMGYGIWTYRDYGDNKLFNAQFALGMDGWRFSGGSCIVEDENGKSAMIPSGGNIYQNLGGRMTGNTGKDTYVKLRTGAAEKCRLTIRMGSQSRTVDVKEERKVELKFSNCRPSDFTISVSGGKGAYVDDVQVYTFVTQGELYNMDGSEGKCIEALRLMNQKL
ncbi:hypothetical protein [Enterocloster clostridioformis]|uniref:hypothetical protein n=1 Tax=Enterocloster clostridioformis TaxID=1531 RepID=UPI0003FF5697|nr:hypothetical protein [Enterocloster clostridioformis]